MKIQKIQIKRRSRVTPYPYFLGFLSLILTTLLGQTVEATDTNYSSATGFGFLIMIIVFILIVGILVRIRKGKCRERRGFSAETRKEVRKRQGYKCAICNWNPGVIQYDHKDGNRHNNNISNCQALCPNCHAKKTRGLLKAKPKTHTRLWIKAVVAVFFFVILMGGIMGIPK
jgi:hypothetical protein